MSRNGRNVLRVRLVVYQPVGVSWPEAVAGQSLTFSSLTECSDTDRISTQLDFILPIVYVEEVKLPLITIMSQGTIGRSLWAF